IAVIIPLFRNSFGVVGLQCFHIGQNPVGPCQQGFPPLWLLFVPVAVHHGHPGIVGKILPVPVNEVPVQAVERAGLIAGGVLHPVVAVLAVVRHALDVFAAGGVWLGAQVAAIGVHHHAQGVGQL